MEFELFYKIWDNTALMPDSEVSIFTMNGLEGLGCFSMGAVVKAALSLAKASVAVGFQSRCLGPLLRGL